MEMTQKNFFNEVVALAKANGRDDLVEYANKKIGQLENRKPSKQKLEKEALNKGIQDTILAILSEADEPMTVTDIQFASESIGELSNQKVSSMLRALVDNGSVVKVVDKKKSYYSVANVATEVEATEE